MNFALRALDDALRPQAATADGGNIVAEAVFLVGFGEVTAAAEGAGSEDKIVQAFAVGEIFGGQPNLFQ